MSMEWRYSVGVLGWVQQQAAIFCSDVCDNFVLYGSASNPGIHLNWDLNFAGNNGRACQNSWFVAQVYEAVAGPVISSLQAPATIFQSPGHWQI